MTQEIRITVDANFYCHHATGFLIDEARFEWKKRITDFFKANAFADHQFVSVKVDIVPHDNDRDYTDDDARRHCGRTYLDVVREAFPGADVDTIERIMCPGRLFPNHPSGVKFGLLCPKASKPNCYACWRKEIPDGEEVQDHDD